MAETAMITARIPREIKRRAEIVLQKQGITTSVAINRLFEVIATTERFPADILPDPHAFPQPGHRELNRNTIKTTKLQDYDALLGLLDPLPIDWREDTGKPYDEIIKEGKRQDHEALSRH
ncbi:MAG: type II toxin-antitoxin system RelB/DinJ family antitoxin [Coriobacteriales bacterium]|jgi:addiction module RelB/DinJ family antitoxin|nr:type II toxin-antitoxin system RelB/DinJ family antitoxin [Coriobacteriales bacterium]